jgi:antibiotic biosynthesis monooxygenase (ABM) superfamily enzyme
MSSAVMWSSVAYVIALSCEVWNFKKDMVFKNLDDIERENREKFKKDITNDASEMVEGILNNVEDVFKRKKIARDKKRPLWKKILLFLLILFLFVLVFDLLLGSVWLLKFFIKSLFHI